MKDHFPHDDNPKDVRKDQHADDPHAPHAEAPAREIAVVWVTRAPDAGGAYHLWVRLPGHSATDLMLSSDRAALVKRAHRWLEPARAGAKYRYIFTEDDA